MATQIHGAGPTGQRSPGLDLAIAGYLAENGGTGGGVEIVSGTVTLDGTGSPVREFYCTASATIEGVAFAAGTAVVFRRTPAGVWGYIVVEPWTDISGTTTTTTTAAATTTTTTTAATTTTTTTAATTTTTTTAVPGTLTYQGRNKFNEVTTATWTAAPIGTASANREVIVMLTWYAGAARYPTIEINGTAATLDYEQTGYRQRGFRLYRMAVPAGTTADIVMPTTSSLFPTMAVWTVDQPVTFLGGTYYNEPSTGVTSVAVTSLSTVAGGFALSGLSQYTNPNTPSTTWTNLAERWDDPGQISTSGGDAATTGTSLTVTAEFTIATVQSTTLSIGAYDWA